MYSDKSSPDRSQLPTLRGSRRAVHPHLLDRLEKAAQSYSHEGVSISAAAAVKAPSPLVVAFAGLCRLVAAHLCDENERTKLRLSVTLDKLYSKPLRDPVHRPTLRALAAS